jgi:hypothetical protein
MGWMEVTQGVGAATGMINQVEGILGMPLANTKAQQQFGMQQELAHQQFQNQLALANNQQKLSQENWDYTNYENQVKHMQNAGLNVGLMYNGSGQGGQSLGQSQGSAGLGSAPDTKLPAASNQNFMGVADNLANIKLKEAQIENVESDTAKKGAEKIEIESRTPTYSKGMEKTDQEIAEMASRMNVNTETMKKIIQEVKASETGQELTKAQTENVEANTQRTKTLTPIEADVMKENWKREVTQNKYLDDKQKAELDNLLQDVINKKAMIEQNDERIDQEQFKKQLESKYPSIMNVVGGTLNQVLTWLTGGKDTNYIHAPERRR